MTPRPHPGVSPMHRRDLLRLGALGSAATLPFLMGGAPPKAPEVPKLDRLRITDVKTILTAPARIRLVVVKVVTSEPGLYGVGCATFTQRPRVVETAIDKYLRPFLTGKDPADIE